LSIERFSRHLIRKAGLTRAGAVTRAVTLIQRFGSALNLNVHFHLLVLDGVYRRDGESNLRFFAVPAPSPGEGQKAFTLQTLLAEPERPRREVAERSGFSLHAGIAAKVSQRDKLEHLARYVARPPVATERRSLTEGGLVRLALKTPYRDGTTHVIFEPEDFIARLAALVPKPRAHGLAIMVCSRRPARIGSGSCPGPGPLLPGRPKSVAWRPPATGNGP
jgi:hypothetical protein